MNRRLLVTAAMSAALLLTGGGVSFARGVHRASKPKYVIALSNSYIGNSWRVEMEHLAEALAATRPYSHLVKLEVYNSGTDPAAQISQIDNMIAAHVNAIIVDPASGTALNAVLNQAMAHHIVVVDFDHAVTSKTVHQVGVNFVTFGYDMGKWMVHALHGKGNVILNRGVQGFSGDLQEYAGEMKALKGHPGMHVIDQVYGQWDESASETAMAEALAAHPNVNGVISQAGSYGVIQAFLHAHHKFVPTTGEASNGWRLMMLKYRKKGLSGVSVGDPPLLGAYALKVAVRMLEGHKEPLHIWVKPPIVTYKQVKPNVNVFPSRPPGFYDDFVGDGFHFSLKQALTGK